MDRHGADDELSCSNSPVSPSHASPRPPAPEPPTLQDPDRFGIPGADAANSGLGFLEEASSEALRYAGRQRDYAWANRGNEIRTIRAVTRAERMEASLLGRVGRSGLARRILGPAGIGFSAVDNYRRSRGDIPETIVRTGFDWAGGAAGAKIGVVACAPAGAWAIVCAGVGFIAGEEAARRFSDAVFDDGPFALSPAHVQEWFPSSIAGIIGLGLIVTSVNIPTLETGILGLLVGAAIGVGVFGLTGHEP